MAFVVCLSASKDLCDTGSGLGPFLEDHPRHTSTAVSDRVAVELWENKGCCLVASGESKGSVGIALLEHCHRVAVTAGLGRYYGKNFKLSEIT